MRITRHPLLAPLGGLRQIPPDDVVIDRLRSGHALIAPVAEDVMRRCFDTLIDLLGPERRSLLGTAYERPARGRQALAGIANVVAGLDDSAAVRAELHGHGRTLARAGFTRGDYVAFVAAFSRAIGGTLGARWTTEVAEEWNRALEIAAATMLEADPAGGGPVHRDDTQRGPVTIERAMRQKLGVGSV